MASLILLCLLLFTDLINCVFSYMCVYVYVCVHSIYTHLSHIHRYLHKVSSLLLCLLRGTSNNIITARQFNHVLSDTSKIEELRKKIFLPVSFVY